MSFQIRRLGDWLSWESALVRFILTAVFVGYIWIARPTALERTIGMITLLVNGVFLWWRWRHNTRPAP